LQLFRFLAVKVSAFLLPSSVEDFYYLPGLVAGRDEIVRGAVQDCLAGRPTILTGVGGIGKTTVATAVMRNLDVQARFGDRCYPVLCHELVLSDTSREGIQLHLVKAIINSMRLPEQPRQAASTEPPSQQLAQALRRLRAQAANGPTLLYLDNMESLSEHAASGVQEILSRLAGMPNLSYCGTSRDKSVDPHNTTSRELLPLDMPDSFDIFSDRLGRSINTGQVEPLQKILEAMEGHPLSIVLLAAFAKVNSVAEAVARWPVYGTELLQNGDKGHRHGSLAATIELSLDSIDTAKHSATRSLLLFLSAQPEGFPAVPERAIGFFSQRDPQAISKLLRLSLVSVREAAGVDKNQAYRVLRPIAQYMQDQYKDLDGENEGEVYRGWVAMMTCLGQTTSLLWIHDDIFAGVACETDADALAGLPICTCTRAKYQNQKDDEIDRNAFNMMKVQIGRSVLLLAPQYYQDNRIGIIEYGATLMNLALSRTVRKFPDGSQDSVSRKLYNLITGLERLKQLAHLSVPVSLVRTL
jgi:hypothetical protein